MLKKFFGRAGRANISAGLTMEDLEELTMNFSANRQFAQGPYGRFYLGCTRDGQRVSVLLLEADVGERLDYGLLQQQLHKLSTLDHPNLVRLLGYSCGKSSALCFDNFSPNGTLHRHLSDASNGLDWRTRYSIIKGTCEATKYIHAELGIRFLHVLLPGNILLDENMEPKLVALGLLQVHCGAYDSKYLAPEYEDTKIDIKKGYIFSLGIVLMELMTGPMSYIRISDMAHPQFIHQVQENWRKRMQQTCSGSELEFCCQQVKSCIMIALSCVDNDEHKRPNITEIIKKLNETECNVGQTEVKWKEKTLKLKGLPEWCREKQHHRIYGVNTALETQLEQPDYDHHRASVVARLMGLDVLTPTEAAPCKLQERIGLSQILTKGSKEAHGREEPVLYREIERRLKQHGIQAPAKDTETLKRILYDMELKGLLKVQEREEASMLKSLYDLKLAAIRKPLKSASPSSQVYSSTIPQRDSSDSDLPQLQTRRSSDTRKASKLDRAAKEQHAESSSSVPFPQSLPPYIRMPDGRKRNEHGSSKKNSSLVRMDGMYISQLEALERIIDRSEPPCNLSLAVLQIITKNFSDELIIGRGGCGVVYKGILTNGIIAVKKLFNSYTVDDKMFHQEVQSMMIVNHQNTVRFLGYCSHTEEKAMNLEGTVIMAQIRERLLCFEYIGNGSLESHLTDELRGLEWHTRYLIIQGICEGLQHLHKEKHIIHMDLKPANILIDDCMVPKITDFGLSRLDDKSQTMSAQRLLSLGYCAPEYLHHGKRSAKSDIYSLGVIILELVTGSKQTPCTTKVLRKWKHRWNKSTKDIQLGYEQVSKCLNLARRCIQTDPVDRPNIWDIIRDLDKMDKSDVDISDATECLELEDMLGIEPLEIHLPFELNKQISCLVELTNDTDDYFAFRISMTGPRPYCINTNKDILPPRSKCSVTITLQALEKEPPHNQRRDEFSVQSTRVDGSLAPTDITGKLFAEHSGKVVDDVNLVVVLDVPPPLPGDR